MLADEIGQLAYRVWYFPSLWYDEDQRDNQVNASRQQVQILFAKWKQAASWFNPELLRIPLETVRLDGAIDASSRSTVLRSRICTGCRSTCSTKRGSGCCRSPAGSPARRPTRMGAVDGGRQVPDGDALDGRPVTLSYGQYRAILATARNQADRALAFRAFHGSYASTLNTYATLYNGVCQRDWFLARARGYATRSTRRCTSTTFRPPSSTT